MIRLKKLVVAAALLAAFGVWGSPPPALALSPAQKLKQGDAILTILLKDGRVVNLGDKRIEDKNTRLPAKSPAPQKSPGRIEIRVEPRP